MLAWLATTEPSPDETREPTPVVDVSWSAPATCPDAEAIRVAITDLVGRPLGANPDRTLQVTGTVVETGDGFSLELRVSEGAEQTTRRFDARRCVDLVEPAAVVVALAVDPRQAAVVPQPESAVDDAVATEVRDGTAAGRETSSPPIAAPPVESHPSSRRRPARRWRPRAVLGARGGVDGGNLPAVGGILEGSVGVLLGRARIEVNVAHLFSRRLDRGGQGGTFRVTAARPQACWAPAVRRVDFPLCAGVELGSVRARGFGVTPASTVQRMWVALVGGVGVVWMPLPWLGLGVRAELVVAPMRRAFTLDDAHLFTTGVVAGRGLAGVEFRLP